jgi:hypothetical protein
VIVGNKYADARFFGVSLTLGVFFAADVGLFPDFLDLIATFFLDVITSISPYWAIPR